MLNSQQILDEGLLKLEHTQGKPAQVGFDITLKQVNKIGSRIGGNTYRDGKIGKVLKDKTELTTYTPYPLQTIDGVVGWLLHEGTYDITFNEGCKIPDNRVAFIKQRSSLYRNGAIINSPVFDPGFETEFMGTVMIVTETIFIEENARVAQFIVFSCKDVDKENIYGGANHDSQFQNDNQRLV